ncbi:hypothetical protein C2869_15595 [Saccharobesus litoralis]|uniref:Uncharacterized protein n=1 Tax=Saccharobesus litoralis TaxID=2172099 RepID=A0A2S0VUA5_9ALTE|nr:hypothetical protein C2869_15595 [Saccharobesus litoralis]
MDIYKGYVCRLCKFKCLSTKVVFAGSASLKARLQGNWFTGSTSINAHLQRFGLQVHQGLILVNGLNFVVKI